MQELRAWHICLAIVIGLALGVGIAHLYVAFENSVT